MILNLGAERIVIITEHDTHVLPFEQVEEHLTQTIVELYQEYRPPVLYVINGPGSFTNLRVGALVANLMVSLGHGLLELRTLDKISLLRYLYHQAVLPQYAYLYFGQRKNFWVYDFATDTFQTYPQSTLSDTNDVQGDYSVDRFLGGDFPAFVSRSQEIVLSYENNKVIVHIHNESLDCTDIFLSTQKIDPIYGIEPNIG